MVQRRCEIAWSLYQGNAFSLTMKCWGFQQTFLTDVIYHRSNPARDSVSVTLYSGGSVRRSSCVSAVIPIHLGIRRTASSAAEGRVDASVSFLWKDQLYNYGILQSTIYDVDIKAFVDRSTKYYVLRVPEESIAPAMIKTPFCSSWKFSPQPCNSGEEVAPFDKGFWGVGKRVKTPRPLSCQSKLQAAVLMTCEIDK